MKKQKLALRENRTFWTNPFAVALSAVLLFFMAQLLGVLVAGPFMPYLPGKNIRLLFLIFTNSFMLFGLISAAKQLMGFSWKALGLKIPRLTHVLVALPAFIVYLLISLSLTILAQQLIPGFDIEQAQDIGFTNTRATSELVATFISLVILTPIFEETIFRGVLFKGLRERVPFWLAAIGTSIIFAIAHGQWNVAVDTFALSLILCFLVERSGSIWPAILLHALKNGLAFTLLFIYPHIS